MTLDKRWLPLLAEECAEVIQAVSKIQRFGVNDSADFGSLNGVTLALEVGDLLAVVQAAGLDLTNHKVMEGFRLKLEKLKTYGPDGTYFTQRGGEAGAWGDLSG